MKFNLRWRREPEKVIPDRRLALCYKSVVFYNMDVHCYRCSYDLSVLSFGVLAMSFRVVPAVAPRSFVCRVSMHTLGLKVLGLEGSRARGEQ